MGKWKLRLAAVGIFVLGLAGLVLWSDGQAPSSEVRSLGLPDTNFGEEPALRGARKRLAQPRTLELHARTSAGHPPPEGTQVIFATPPALRAEREGRHERVFDADDFAGHVLRIPDVHYRLWLLVVVAPGHFGISRELVLPPREEAAETVDVVELVLQQFAALSVLVTDHTGAAVGACRVSVGGLTAVSDEHPLHPADRPNRRRLNSLRTDRLGRVEIEGLPPEQTLVLTAEHAEYPPTRTEEVTPAAGGSREITLVLQAPSGIKGQIDVAAFGAPAEAIALTLYHHTQATASFQRRASIARDGTFFLRNVRAGTSTLQVVGRSPELLTMAIRRVVVPGGETVDLGLIEPDDGPPLHVIIRVDAPYPKGARVRAHFTAYTSSRAEIEAVVLAAKEEGSDHDVPLDRLPIEFALPIDVPQELRGIPPGALSLFCMLVDRAGGDVGMAHELGRAGVTADARHLPLEVVIKRKPGPVKMARIDFRVTPPEGVRPARFRHSLLILSKEGRVLGGHSALFSPGAWNSQGQMAASDEEAVMYAFGHGRMAGPVDYGSLQQSKLVGFKTWTRAAELAVVVRDAEDKPVSEADIGIRLHADSTQSAYSATTGQDGRATFTVLPDHAVFIVVTVNGGRGPSHASVEAAELRRGSKITRVIQTK